MIKKNQQFIGANQKRSVLDLYLPSEPFSNLVVFLHGYKGYKDWGAWHLVAHYFMDKGIGFCSFNFSHNGGTVENPIDFPDLTAFAQNRYSYEVKDVEAVLNWLSKNELNHKKIHLIGHSRGGGIAVLSALKNNVTSLTTWASVADFKERFPRGQELIEWKNTGVWYVQNGRTKQNMPHNFSFYEDYIENEQELDIKRAAIQLKLKQLPCLHIHGKNDEAVDHTAMESLSEKTGGKTYLLSTNHTFNSKHPWNAYELPHDLKSVCQKTVEFIYQAV